MYALRDNKLLLLSRRSRPTLSDSQALTGSPVPDSSEARTRVAAIFLSSLEKRNVEKEVTSCVRLSHPMDSHGSALSMDFLHKKYWSAVPSASRDTNS